MVDNLEKLLQLDLSLNILTNISFNRNSSKFEYLNLRRTKLTTITSETFKFLHGVIELYLDNCHISEMHVNSFENLKQLAILCLYKNPIDISSVVRSLIVLQSYNKLNELSIGNDHLLRIDNQTFSPFNHPFKSITSLAIYFMSMTHIGNGTFLNFPSLRTLTFNGE